MGQNNGWTGRRHSDATKAKISAAKTGQPGVTAQAQRQFTVKSCGKAHAWCNICHPTSGRAIAMSMIGNKNGRKNCSTNCICGRHAHDPYAATIASRYRGIPTRPQLMLAAFLHGCGFAVDLERRFGRFSIDCYLPEYHVAFEADGTYWHSLPKTIAHDIRRDAELLQEFALPVIRFREDEITTPV